MTIPVFDPPQSPEQIRRVIAHSLVEVRAGQIQPKIANAVAVLASVLLKSIDADDFERRLAAMESLLQRRGGKGRRHEQ